MKTFGLLAAALGLADATIDYNRVHLVDAGQLDTAAPQYLFRGNLPVDSDGKFDYDTLMDYIGQRAAEEGNFTLPDDVFLHVISFENPFNGPSGWWDEKNWIAANPDKAALSHYLLIGDVLPPSVFDDATVQEYATSDKFWSIDQIPDRLAATKAWIHDTPADVPTVYYGHCTAGCDRTGEFFTSYYMTYGSSVWEDATNITTAYQLSTDQCGRSPNYFSTSAIEWYCYRMQYEGTEPAVGCEDFADCKWFGDCTPTAGDSVSLSVEERLAELEAEERAMFEAHMAAKMPFYTSA